RITSYFVSPPNLQGPTSAVEKKGRLSIGEVVVSYSYKNTMVESKIFTTITVADIVPSTKVITSIKLPDLSSHKLEVQYFHHHATVTSVVILNKSPIVDLTATLGTPAIAFGVEAGYDTTSSNSTKYTAGVNVSKPESCTPIVSGDKGDTIKAWYLHHLDQLKKSAAVAEISRRFSTNENTGTVGGVYAIDDLTVVRAKLSNHGKLGAVHHQVIPKSIVTISSEFDTMALDKCPRFGLTLAFKP
ncbi:Mitochondrial outer membrane protein porin 2, partial [Bienertia sinuspersici]